MTSPVPVLPVQSMKMLSFDEIKQAYLRSQSIPLADPSLAHVEMPYRKTLYPLGFPLQLQSNAEEIIDIASEMWRGATRIFDTQPIEVEVGVTESDARECPPATVSRIRRHICTNVADSRNFLVSDMAQGFSFAWMTQAALAHPGYVRYFFLEAAALCQIASRFTTPVHAAAVALDGQGILLCGDSGAGKSTLAYACARAGWTYITDDGSFLVNGREDCLMTGNNKIARFRPSAETLFPELGGKPIIQRSEIGKPSIEFKIGSSANLATSSTAQIRKVVFLNRHNVRQQELAPLPKEIAHAHMMQVAYTIPEVRKAQEAMIQRLLQNGVYELRYTDLDWAVERLSKLVREGQ